MADDESTPSQELRKSEDGAESDTSNDSAKADRRSPETEIISPETEEAVKKLMEEGGPKALLSFFGSRTTFGPDPETAKVLAEVEKHSEETRLKGYQATLENRDKQNQRDHEFRIKRLNHASIKTGIILGVSVGGIGTGLYLSIQGRTQLGGYILVASLMALLQVMNLKPPPTRGGES